MLNFHAAELNQYAYYLEGFEKDWNLGSRNNMATYRNVPPGRYIFKVKGCNSFGVWSSEETTLAVSYTHLDVYKRQLMPDMPNSGILLPESVSACLRLREKMAWQ